MKRFALSLGVLALGAVGLVACEPGSDDSPTGIAGTTGSAGHSPASGTAGTTGAAGTSTPGGAGTTGTAGTGTVGAAGTTGAAGTGVNVTGTAGSSAAAGSGGGGTDTRKGMSAGCGKPPPATDSSGKFTKHDITVDGVDASILAKPANVGGYTWTKRNFFLKLPANYDPDTAYSVQMGGGGCGNTNGLSGDSGGFQVPGVAPGAIQIGLSYVYNNGACFADSGVNTPEVQYFDTIMKELDANYCYDKGKVFIAGFSSGAWESYSLGLARSNVIRGIGTGAGGLRAMRPPAANVPFAAFLLTGAGDGENPITGPTGSGLARDAILAINKCTGTTTETWPGLAGCVKYTGCPAAFPVIWCTPPGQHTDGGAAWRPAMSAGWAALPAVP